MLKPYNTLSREKEVFKPRQRKKVNLFVCGITPYDFSHIGHARTYVNFDVIAKCLRQKGYNVFYLQNITDIDDKIIKRAKEKKISPQKLARDFEKEYLKDMKDLKVNSVSKYARATEHIKEIISQVERLLKKGFAYQIKDGVYYNIAKFKNYGKLSRRTILQAEDAVSRIDEAKKKINKGDFCLWKFFKPGEPKWKSPWGWGRPGWHIEDTAITEKYFGPQYDIHGGGKDLIFPHHEAEIAQMEAISDKSPLVKCWLHSGFLTVNGQKMAKSLGNFITIRDFLRKHSPRLLRLLIIKNHYRSPLDYNEKLISRTKRELERIDEFIEKIRNPKLKFQNKSKIEFPVMETRGKKKTKFSSPIQISKYEKKFEKAMEDNFNTPKAIAAIFSLVNRGNFLIAKDKLSPVEARDILKFLKKIDEIFSFVFWGKKVVSKTPPFIEKMAGEREIARKKKDWKLADEIRRKIQRMGYKIEDGREGPKLKKISYPNN